jgi:hypothetical protein
VNDAQVILYDSPEAAYQTDDWCDDLPPEGDLPDSVRKALDALNEAIKAAGPVSWFEEPIAIDVADLRARVNARKAVSE